jgi:hypothetical protein
MSLPPTVTVAMVVELVTWLIWFASRSCVVAPEQATKSSDVFARCCTSRYG